jgi:ATP-dependent helicase/nuclease subunit A
MNSADYTPDQLEAINARGNTLVVAGAGAGKTGTLVEKCIRLLLAEHIEISKILVVTFTEAAAAEVRDRIRRRLEEAAQFHPGDEWILKQLAALDSAHICTLHSFCLALLRENFFALDLDPAISVLPSEQAEMLFHEVFDELLNEHFAFEHSFSGDVQHLIAEYFGGWEKGLRDFVRTLHHYTQTRPRPEEWFARQIAQLEAGDAMPWQKWYESAIRDWCLWWLPYLENLPAENENAHHCASLLRSAVQTGDVGIVQAVLQRKDCWPKGKKGVHSALFKSIFEEAEFLDALREPGALKNDWHWHARPLLSLVRFAQQFGSRFQAAKKLRGAVDFHDLEQGALQLLWCDHGSTAVAKRWQERLAAVFVDEYQDINSAQDLIIRALSREGAVGNRFLVGDIKQSIYAFRQADPSIFGGYLKASRTGADWKAVFLSDNFRSHEGLLRFINPFFAWLMREDVGGVAYDSKAALKFGACERRAELALSDDSPPVEFHLILKGREDTPEVDSGESEDLEAAEVEARHVAVRLRELKENRHFIYHQKEARRRPVEWKDMVVLLRAASAKVEVYAKAFADMGVPLETKRDGFFTAQEVLDLCNLLTILDNPLQDIPLVAVLRSPIVGLSANELASIRASAGKDARSFWAALNFYLKKQNDTGVRVQAFLQRYHRWRDPRRCFSLAQRLERVLADTGYAEWLLSQPRGRQRYANVQQLVRVARQFDDARGESLYLFLRHLQQLQETAGDIEPATISDADAVRLMTVHQSKGLEFPVVAVADLGKLFNTSDQRSSILLHPEYGICAMIKAPESGARYPSLPLWLARRELQLDSLGEEMRVLYVALTRAENLLLLFGSTSEKQTDRWAAESASEHLHPQQLVKSRSWLDWLGMHATRSSPGWLQMGAVNSLPFSVRILTTRPQIPAREALPKAVLTEVEWQTLRQRIEFTYPHARAVEEPAKTSVSAVRNRMESDEDVMFGRFAKMAGGIDGRTRGVAAHSFLQHLDLRGECDEVSLRAQAANLTASGLLTSEELKLIDFAAVAAFWESEIGREIRQRWRDVKRELPFTFKLGRAELASLGAAELFPIPEGEFVVTQGVADLVVLGSDDVWLLDFKTDSVRADEVPSKAEEYRPQVALYSLALEAIYRRPVTRRGLYFLAAQKLHWL